jgi:hypothetical protein
MALAGSVADHVVALALRAAGDGGAGPMAGRAARIQRTGETPLYGSRGRDSLNRLRATGSDLSRSPSFPADRRQTSLAGKPPLTAGSMGTYAEFVIAVADGEFLRRLCGPHNLARYERPYRQVGCGLLAPWLWRIQRP